MSNLATAPIAGAFNLLQLLLPPGVQSATYRRRTGSTYSTSTGETTNVYDSGGAGTAVQVSLQEYGRHERADSAIQPSDRKALIQSAQLAAEPQIGDLIVVGAESLVVVAIDPETDPALVVWVLQVRP